MREGEDFVNLFKSYCEYLRIIAVVICKFIENKILFSTVAWNANCDDVICINSPQNLLYSNVIKKKKYNTLKI